MSFISPSMSTMMANSIPEVMKGTLTTVAKAQVLEGLNLYCQNNDLHH